MGKITATLFTEPYGDDLMVVNMAKQSNDRQSDWYDPPDIWNKGGSLRDKDKSLIKFLATGMTTKQRDELSY